MTASVRRLSILASVLFAPTATAAPLLGSGEEVEGVRVYRDSAAPRMFYYAPGKLAIAPDRAGQPQFSFLQMRYTGTAAAGDRGAFRTRSVLSFHVRMDAPAGDRLAKTRAALRTRLGAEPLLKPLPLRRVTTTLNYTPLAGTETAPPPPEKVGAGALEEPAEPAAGGGFWTERVFTLGPDDLTSQALWDAFQKGRVLLSLSYAFYADGVGPDEALPGTPGAPKEPAKGPHLVLSDTLAVTVDAARYPDRLRRVDVNDSIPAQYAVLSVACYDFNNALRPDLQVKVVEIEAKSVTGRPVKREVTFTQGAADVAMASVRFPFAVSLKDGYRYRTREITAAGEETVKPWREGRPWTQLLDVTTPPEERPAVPGMKDEG